MSDAISMFVKGNPIPDKRPRVTRNGTYMPTEVTAWKKVLRVEMLRIQGCMAPSLFPVEVHMVFNMPMPKSWSDTKRKKYAATPHMQRPDVDNLAKAVLDAANGVLWKDDAQVYRLRITKHWSDHSGVMVDVMENIFYD